MRFAEMKDIKEGVHCSIVLGIICDTAVGSTGLMMQKMEMSPCWILPRRHIVNLAAFSSMPQHCQCMMQVQVLVLYMVPCHQAKMTETG
jgi:hypothetical protein